MKTLIGYYCRFVCDEILLPSKHEILIPQTKIKGSLMRSRIAKNSECEPGVDLLQKNKKRPRPKVLEGSKWTYFGHTSGWCHFHIVTNQKRQGRLWVEVMASCERETRFWIPWNNLADPSLGWHMGWVKKDSKN